MARPSLLLEPDQPHCCPDAGVKPEQSGWNTRRGYLQVTPSLAASWGMPGPRYSTTWIKGLQREDVWKVGRENVFVCILELRDNIYRELQRVNAWSSVKQETG